MERLIESRKEEYRERERERERERDRVRFVPFYSSLDF